MTEQTIKFAQRRIVLLAEQHRTLAMAMVANMPLGTEVVGRSPVKQRSPDQNSLMWVGPLADIAAQAWVAGRQYSAEVWHDLFKKEYLPEEDDPNLHELVKDPITWRKWDYNPFGDRVLVGSTTDLTKKGFSQYLEQIHAYGSLLGVQFSSRRMAA